MAKFSTKISGDLLSTQEYERGLVFAINTLTLNSLSVKKKKKNQNLAILGSAKAK